MKFDLNLILKDDAPTESRINQFILLLSSYREKIDLKNLVQEYNDDVNDIMKEVDKKLSYAKEKMKRADFRQDFVYPEMYLHNKKFNVLEEGISKLDPLVEFNNGIDNLEKYEIYKKFFVAENKVLKSYNEQGSEYLITKEGLDTQLNKMLKEIKIKISELNKINNQNIPVALNNSIKTFDLNIMVSNTISQMLQNIVEIAKKDGNDYVLGGAGQILATTETIDKKISEMGISLRQKSFKINKG